MDTLRDLFRAEEFDRCRKEINDSNRLALHNLAIAGIPLSLSNILAQTIFKGLPNLSLQSCWLLIYFVILFIADRWIIPEDSKNATALIYLAGVPVMVVSILLGTVWDPNHQALTFLLFLLAMPVFVFDHPLRVTGLIFGWSAVFMVLCLFIKNPSTHRGDFFHLLEFGLAALAVSYVMISVRLDALRNLEKTRYLLDHDQLTGLQNNFSLERNASKLLGKALIVSVNDIDEIGLYRDFYGHEAGDTILKRFADKLCASFGEEYCFHYNGDELLCIAHDQSESAFLQRVADCRSEMRNQALDGKAIHLNCTVGYVTGTPEDVSDLWNMVQLAEIYAHKARTQGRGQTLGGSFDEEHFRAGVIESNLETHAKAHEVDALTGLPSMSFFINRADELLSAAVDISRKPVLGYINIANLRNFNDKFSYAEGDRLLRFTARQLHQVYQNRQLCHIVGGKYAVLCYEDEAVTGLDHLNVALRNYKADYTVQARAGFAEYIPGESSLSAVDKAKLACDSIVNPQKTPFRFYDAKLNEELSYHQYVVTRLDEAIENDRIKVYYQPIARTATGHICNEEALSRWDDPVYGFLMPSRYIPLLEDSRTIYKLDLFVVSQVIRDMKKKAEIGVPVVPVSVNLSRADFEQCDMVSEIVRLVDEAGLARSMIKIEITESAFVENQNILFSVVERFHKEGFEVWLDDFGSEYSILNLLEETDFDLIKIDMQFMKNFNSSEKNMIIVSSIIEMAHRMGVATLIEGVETKEHFDALQQLGCDKVQGFWFNKPNTLQYIIERATSKTGLVFETPEEAASYARGGLQS